MKKKFIIIGLIAIIALILVGFYFAKTLIGKDVKEADWKLTGWNVSSLSPEVAIITLNFDKGKINGNGGVNSYSANYTMGINNQFSLSDITSTEMASTNPDINRAEGIYFTLLNEVRYYKIDNNLMELLDKNKNTLLIFERQ